MWIGGVGHVHTVSQGDAKVLNQNRLLTFDTNILELCFLGMKKTLFLQPRHIYAPPEGEGHIYTPTSLWTMGSKLGVDIDYADENIRPADINQYDIIGVNLVGLPYIDVVRERFRSILEKGSCQKLFVGGTMIEGLVTKPQEFGGKKFSVYTREELVRFFGEHIGDGNLPAIAKATGADYETLPKDEFVSLIPAYKKIPDEDMRKYLDSSREISFYLSQGCIQNCDFCGANNNKEEQYRDMHVIEKDLIYLTERALKLGIHELSMYLSNLDVFQTPEVLGKFASLVLALRRKYPGFEYRIHGLAITSSLVRTRKQFAHVLRDIKDAGFHTVGLGVDGGDDETRRLVHKGFVNDGNVLESMAICNEFDITPETIMVFGGPRETQQSLDNAVELTGKLQEKFGAVPRPHVFKDLIPGNKYWNETAFTPRAKERKEIMFADPRYCQAQDFKAMASSLSHSNETQRGMVNESYVKMTNMCPDERDRNGLIYPIAPEFSKEVNEFHRKRNIGRFDR